MAGIGDSIEVPIRVKSFDIPVNLAVNVSLSLEVEGEAQSNFDDVGDFHHKFGLGNTTHGESGPVGMPAELFDFRLRLMQEELNEYSDAVLAGDEAGAFDALLDLVYVTMGTAHLQGFPWQEGWNRVQAANMTKIRATTNDQSLRGGTWDVVKGPDFVPPDIEGLLIEYGWPSEE